MVAHQGHAEIQWYSDYFLLFFFFFFFFFLFSILFFFSFFLVFFWFFFRLFFFYFLKNNLQIVMWPMRAIWLFILVFCLRKRRSYARIWFGSGMWPIGVKPSRFQSSIGRLTYLFPLKLSDYGPWGSKHDVAHAHPPYSSPREWVCVYLFVLVGG